MAAERIAASGFARSRPAMSGGAVDRLVEAAAALARRGCARERGGGQHAHRAGQHGGLVGQDVAEEVSRLAITSKSRGRRIRCNGHRVDQHVLVGDVGVLASDLVRDLAPQRTRRDVRLVDEVSFRRRWRARAKAAWRRRAISASYRGACRRLAPGGCRAPLARLGEVDAARQLAHHDEIDASRSSRRSGEAATARARSTPGAGWRRGRGPCGARGAPAPGARARRGRPTWAGRRRQEDRVGAARALELGGRERVRPWRRSRRRRSSPCRARAPDRGEAPPLEDRDRLRRHLGADCRRGEDGEWWRAGHVSRRGPALGRRRHYPPPEAPRSSPSAGRRRRAPPAAITGPASPSGRSRCTVRCRRGSACSPRDRARPRRWCGTHPPAGRASRNG